MGELAEQPEETFTHEYVISLLHSSCYSDIIHINRERREHRVFQLLLQMIPGLQERLMESSDEHVGHIAELVREYFYFYFSSLFSDRFRKVLQARDLMTQRA